jgi:YD repeat-containing protein
MTGRVLGSSAITSSYSYFAWNAPNGSGRLLSANHGGSMALQAFAYEYDAVGNIKKITDTLSNPVEVQTFSYDALDRLESATVTGGPEPYDEIYTYGYDANGNMTSRVIGGQTWNLSYDAENRLVSASGPNGFSASFLYDGDGQRVRSTIGGVTTTFVGNHYEVTGGAVTKYYYANGQRIAMRTGSTLYYLLSDHLGSTSITTSSTGAKEAELRYTAWGEVRFTNGSTPTKYQ